MLAAAGYLTLDIVFDQILGYDPGYFFYVGFPLLFLLGDLGGEIVVNLLIEIAERKVFQLALDPGDPQAVGNGRVNIKGFLL